MRDYDRLAFIVSKNNPSGSVSKSQLQSGSKLMHTLSYWNGVAGYDQEENEYDIANTCYRLSACVNPFAL